MTLPRIDEEAISINTDYYENVRTNTGPLQSLRQWIVFSTHPKPDGRIGKLPLIVGTDRKAMIDNPKTWATFAAAFADARRRGLFLGFAMSADDDMTLLDLDGVISPDGTIDSEALWLIAQVDSFTERSISGTGIHIVCEGHPPANFTRRAGIETYPGKRFWLVSGNVIGDRGTIHHRGDKLAQLFPPKPTPALLPSAPLTLDDAAILDRARAARNADKFDRLWSGDVNEHGGDDSAADLALCSILAFWTQDREQLNRLFRQSGLMREKWERTDYREGTIDRALEREEFWTAPTPGSPVNINASVHAKNGVIQRNLQDAATGAELAQLRNEIGTLRTKLAEAEAKLDRLAKLQSATMALLRSKEMRPGEKIIALAALFDTNAAQQRGATEPGGWADTPLERLADAAGCSPETAGRHLTTVSSTGLLESRTVPERDPINGMIRQKRQTRLPTAPDTPAPDLAERILALADAPPRRDPNDKGWGGRRVCPDCGPSAGLVVTTTVSCASCGQILDQTREERPPVPRVRTRPHRPQVAPTNNVRPHSGNESGGATLESTAAPWEVTP